VPRQDGQATFEANLVTRPQMVIASNSLGHFSG
jgi:hypothetical protein